MDDHEERFFESETSRTTWDRIRRTTDRIVNKTFETAGDLAQRGRIELEITSLKIRLRSLYAKLGEKMFHLKEAEEEAVPFENPDVLDILEEIRSCLSHLATERHRLEKMKEESAGPSTFV